MDNLTPLARVRNFGRNPNAHTPGRWRIIGGTSAAVAGTALIGSIATDTNTAWYKALVKPAIQPPGWVFPVAWTALYIDIATVVGRSLADLDDHGEDADYRALCKALAANLVLNAGWSALFFKGKQSGIATVEAAALAVSSADLVRRTMEVDRRRGALLLPYAAWTTFATVLTGTIWYQNR